MFPHTEIHADSLRIQGSMILCGQGYRIPHRKDSIMSLGGQRSTMILSTSLQNRLSINHSLKKKLKKKKGHYHVNIQCSR